MQLYKTYLNLWKNSTVNAGFSPRLPDYGTKYWLECLQKALPVGARKTFLDIGAGDGRLSLLLLTAYHPEGAALEVQVNAHAWKPIVDRYNQFSLKTGLLQETMQELVGKQEFDFILLSEVFEHIPPADVQDFLKNLRPLLSQDGTVFLTTPNRVARGPAETSAEWHEKQPYGHYKHYTHDEMQELLSAAGFKIEWRAFECHSFKKTFYNKWFYPLSRLDGRVLGAKKISPFVKELYRWGSLPFIVPAQAASWTCAQAVYTIEKHFSNERNADTMIFKIKKA